MDLSPRRALSSRLLLAGAALLAAAPAQASEKRTLTIGATVIAVVHCRVENATSPRCTGKTALPVPSLTDTGGAFTGGLEMRISRNAATLDSRRATTKGPVVLTVAP